MRKQKEHDHKKFILAGIKKDKAASELRMKRKERAKEAENVAKTARAKGLLIRGKWTTEPTTKNSTDEKAPFEDHKVDPATGKRPLEIWQLCKRGMTVEDCSKLMRKPAELQAKANKKQWAHEDEVQRQEDRANVMLKTGTDSEATIVTHEVCNELSDASRSGNAQRFKRMRDKVSALATAARQVAVLEGRDPKSVVICPGFTAETETGELAIQKGTKGTAHPKAKLRAWASDPATSLPSL